MSKGQLAMAAWLTAASGANNNYYSTTSIARDSSVSQGLVGWAKVVAEHAPDLVMLVISGAKPLKDAYDAVGVMLVAAERRENGRWKRGSIKINQESRLSTAWAKAMLQVGLVLDYLPELAPAVIESLVTSKGWERAAIVAAFVTLDKKGGDRKSEDAKIKARSSSDLTADQFAAPTIYQGFRGKRSPWSASGMLTEGLRDRHSSSGALGTERSWTTFAARQPNSATTPTGRSS